jgi:multiple antibiotic resistance protein
MHTEKFLSDFMLIWATVDPIGTLALFAGVTAKMTRTQRRKTAIKAILYSAGILVGAIIFGQIILKAMGIPLEALQVAGGIILFLFGLQMVFGNLESTLASAPEEGHDIAVFPLAVPSIASPGAITAVILITDNDVYPIMTQVGTGAMLLIVLVITCLLMLGATRVLHVIGKNGASILIRVMGLILAALSVQLIYQAFGGVFA